MADKSFYADSGFWQFVVAFAALILSQLPPFTSWFRRASLRIEPFDRMALDEEIGLPVSQLHLTISNIGGRAARINRLEMVVTRDDDKRALKSRGYFEKTTDTQATLFIPFNLAPGEEWGYNVVFASPRTSREDRQRVAALTSALQADLDAKVAQRQNQQQTEPVELDERVVAELRVVFDRNFFWRAGEYTVDVAVGTEGNKADATMQLKFTLFESESASLHKHQEQYKYGNGLLFRGRPVQAQFVDLSRPS